MNFSDFFMLMAQASEVEQPGLFPFPFGMHIVFSIISIVFFAWRFSQEKKPYQLIFTIAVPFSLLLWVSESKTLFYTVGAIEFIAIMSAFVTSIVCRKPAKEKSETNTNESREDNNEVSNS